MDANMLMDKWDQVKDLIKSEWNDISDKDIDKIKGKKDQFIRLLQDKYGYNMEIAESKLKSFLEKAGKEINVDMDKAYDMGKHCMNTIENRMQKNTMQTVLIAMGIGFLAERFLRSLFSSK